jgi:phage terminase large subunit GpA-like protein
MLICPHCGHEQSDISNGGDPGEWWNDQYIPDGYCYTNCETCRKEMVIEVEWEPTFKCILPEDI